MLVAFRFDGEMPMHRSTAFILMVTVGLGAAGLGTSKTGAAQTGAGANTAAGANKSWVQRSNQYTQMLLDVQLKHSPESGSAQGLAKYDAAITDATRADEIAQRRELEDVLAQLKKDELKEKDRDVREDLEILQVAFARQFRQDDYQLAHKVQFIDAIQAVYEGLRVLLDDHVATERRAAALARLRKYAGVEPGYKPFTEMLKQRMTEQMAKPGVGYPATNAIEVQLERDKSYLDAIAGLLRNYQMTGWEPAYAKLQEEVAAYDTWVRSAVMPKALKSGPPTPEEYALALESYGVDVPAATLAAQAHAAFKEYQTQMAPLAAQVAKQHGWTKTGYRDVLRELKAKQVTGGALLGLYQTRLKAVDDIIVAKNLVTLPAAQVTMRMATEDETKRSPEPHYLPPPLLGNTGRRGEFVVPAGANAGVPSLSGIPVPADTQNAFDDFTFDAAAWPQTALELRPGHELEFDAMQEHGVSLARALYAVNSTNLESWGLYAQWMIAPYEPAEGQLATLQMRLLDAARAFIDPELASGKATPMDAYKLLTDDVGLGQAFAREEIARCTQVLPAQATTYFFAYTTMLQLRKDTETALGAKFDAKKFNDFVVGQGALPPGLLRKAVTEVFVPAQKR
jgi:uncharacterized protein (DUF885 family)